ncbi:MAG: E2/UBC family protein [Idiomarina sp.]
MKDFIIGDDTFQVGLVVASDPHVELPNAVILFYPEKYAGKLLPHVNAGNYLCYVESMEADWDSNDIRSTYSSVDDQIQKTLLSSIRSIEEGSPDDKEMAGEFASYWEPHDSLYYFVSESRPINLVASFSQGRKIPNVNQLSVYSRETEDDYRRWLSQRNQIAKDSLYKVGLIRVKPTHISGISWPPESLSNVLEWLRLVDRPAFDKMVDYFATKQSNYHILLLDVFKQDMIAFQVQLNPNILNHKRKLCRLSGRQRKRYATILASKPAVESFHRLGVVKADKKTILTRNRRRPEIGDLSTKNIALIGCGTIGSHLAGLLIRAGAGCGAADFHLYDPDRLEPHNYSRNALGSAYFDRNKAEAMSEQLKSSSHLVHSILGIPKAFPISADRIGAYDIVLDATGRPPVSRRLAYKARELDDERRPILIHGFNDGNGRISKVIIDSGDACYGCLLSNTEFYNSDEMDIRFTHIDERNEKRISCGNTYTPYDAAVSVITAALMQDAALQTLEDNFTWTYSEHVLDGRVFVQPMILTAQVNCRVCNGR